MGKNKKQSSTPYQSAKTKSLSDDWDTTSSDTEAIENQVSKLQSALNERNTFLSAEMARLSNLIKDNIETQNKKLEGFENRIEALENDLKEQKTSNEKQNKIIKDLSDKLEDTISHSRRLNLIISGVAEKADENVFEVIKHFFTIKLKVSTSDFDKFLFRDFHRLGPKSSADDDGNVFKKERSDKVKHRDPHRPIIVAFIQQYHRNSVLSHAKNLTPGDNLSIKPDLSPAMSRLRNNLLQVRRDIKNLSNNNLAQLGYISYRPVLFVKINGERSIYKDDMDINLCE